MRGWARPPRQRRVPWKRPDSWSQGATPTRAAAGGAELGHVGAQAGGVEWAEAGDRAQDRDAEGEGVVGVDAGLDPGIEGLHDGGAERVAVDFRAQLAQGVAVRDELVPQEGEQVAETAQAGGRGRRGLQAAEEAVAGQHGGVDLVVLGAAAAGSLSAKAAKPPPRPPLTATPTPQLRRDTHSY